MSKEQSELEIVENFIYNEEVERIFYDIENSLMDFNIFEITGMGDQEIKHSNLIGWLLGDNEHGLKYVILERFLKKVVERSENRDFEDAKTLKKYTYLSMKPKDIVIYREKDNIDLLVLDKANNVAIVIENKVYAGERTDGKDDGQLSKYEEKMQAYSENEQYFIFLTIDGEKPIKGQKNWMIATHQMIGESVEEVLQIKQHEFSIQTKLILESYIDLLKRRNIMKDDKLEEMCNAIWKKHQDALDVLLKYKTTLISDFTREIEAELKQHGDYFGMSFDGEKWKRPQVFNNIQWKQETEPKIGILIYKTKNIIWLGWVYNATYDQTREIINKMKINLNSNETKILSFDNESISIARNHAKEDLFKELEKSKNMLLEVWEHKNTIGKK